MRVRSSVLPRALLLVIVSASLSLALGPYAAVEIIAPADTQDLFMYAANALGHAVGERVITSGPADVHKGVIWRNGVLSDLQGVPSLPGYDEIRAFDLNDSDMIVGEVCGTGPSAPAICRPVLWMAPDQPAIELGTFQGAPSFALSIGAQAINASGAVVGSEGGPIVNSVAQNFAFLRPPGGSLQNLATSAVALAINASGTVVVATPTTRYLWTSGGTTPLGDLQLAGFGERAVPHRLNDAGDLIVHRTAGATLTSVRAANGTVTDLPALSTDPPSTVTTAFALDGDGQAGGWLGPFDPRLTRAVLWESNRTPVLLQGLVPATPAGMRWVKVFDLRANGIVLAQAERDLLNGVNGTEDGKEYPFFLLTRIDSCTIKLALPEDDTDASRSFPWDALNLTKLEGDSVPPPGSGYPPGGT